MSKRSDGKPIDWYSLGIIVNVRSRLILQQELIFIDSSYTLTIGSMAICCLIRIYAISHKQTR